MKMMGRKNSNGIALTLAVGAMFVHGGEARKPVGQPTLRIERTRDGIRVSWTVDQAKGFFLEDTESFEAWRVIHGPIGSEPQEWNQAVGPLDSARYYRLRQ